MNIHTLDVCNKLGGTHANGQDVKVCFLTESLPFIVGLGQIMACYSLA